MLLHGDSPYAEQCIESLLAQSSKSNIILVSSTPSDFQRRLAQGYDLPYIVNPAHVGVAADWNFAMEQIKTPYVTLAHQDDHYNESYLQTMLDAFSNGNDGLIAFSDYTHINSGIHQKKPPLLLIKKAILSIFFGFGVSGYKLRKPFFKRLLVAFSNPICCPTVMYQRQNLASMVFDDDFQVNLDWKYWIDLAAMRGSFVYVPQDLLRYRAHADTSTNLALDSGKRQREDRQCFQLLWPKPVAWLLSRVYSLSYSRMVR